MSRYEKYKSIHKQVKEACNCIEGNSCSQLESDIERIKNSFPLQISSWQDSANAAFEEGLNKCQQKLNSILISIQTTFKTTEVLYFKLDLALKNLSTVSSDLEYLEKTKPNKEDYMPDREANFQFLWNNYCEKAKIYKEQCDMYEEEVLELIDKLKKYNNDSIFITSMKIPNPLFPYNPSQMLLGYELVKFKLDNNISLDDSIVVYQMERNVNGVPFNVYTVADKNLEYTESYAQYIESALSYAALVDKDVLTKVQASGTSFIFINSPDCDFGSLGEYALSFAGYCNSNNRNIILGHDDWTKFSIASTDIETLKWMNDASAQAIIHEIGHAYDFVLMKERTGDLGKGISEIGWYNLDNGYINANSETIAPSSLTDMFIKDTASGRYCTWQDLILKESKSALKNIENFAYDYQSFCNSHTEYLAESFGQYYLQPENLQEAAPLTYATIEHIIGLAK